MGLATAPSARQNLGNRFCFHTGPLATYDTPYLAELCKSGAPA